MPWPRERSLLCAALAVPQLLLGSSGLEYSKQNGFGNNPDRPALGSTGDFYISPAVRSYQDDAGTMVSTRPPPREVSSVLGRQTLTAGSSDHSVAMLAWGQTIAHDVGDLRDNATDRADMAVPAFDPAFDAEGTGTKVLEFNRGEYKLHDPAGTGGPSRHFIDHASSFIDASWLYAGDFVREKVSGRLLMPGDYFPSYQDTAPEKFSQCLAPRTGDGRAAENPGLLHMYLLFGREHNRISAELAAASPTWDDEKLYQEARMRNIALVQRITLEEYAPGLLGASLKTPASYSPDVDPRISLLFATAAYRYGHSAVPGFYNVGDQRVALRDVQFNSCQNMLDSDLVIRGMPTTPVNPVDTQFVTDVRDHLKTSPSLQVGAHDLFSTNIQRGRDVGLPSYNDARELLGLPRVNSFEDLVAGTGFNPTVLKELYGDISTLDFYVGGLLERKEVETRSGGSSELGESFAAVIRDQFQRLRTGDRFWYEWHPELATFVQGRGLQQVIQDNTQGGEIAPAPFHVPTQCPPAEPTAAGVTPLGTLGITMQQRMLPGDLLELSMVGPADEYLWFGVGFGPKATSMNGADFIIVELDGSTGYCVVSDRWGSVHAAEPSQDEGVASFEVSECASENGVVRVKVVRPLAASDPTDFTIDPDSQAFLYAASKSAWPAYHGQLRGGGTISLNSGSVSTAPDNRLRNVWILHGVVMIGLFSFGYPVAIISVMFFRHTRGGFIIHKMVGQLGISAMIVTVVANALVSNSDWTAHHVMGTLTVIAAAMLAIFGNLLENVSLHVRRYLRVVHKSLGYVTMLTAPTTTWLGFRLLRPFESPALTTTPVIWYFPVLFVIGVGVGEKLWRQRRKEMSKSDFTTMIRDGAKLTLVHGNVINVEEWSKLHPGGAAVLTPWIGLDATAIFDGAKFFKDRHGISSKYKHSAKALASLESLRHGIVVDTDAAASAGMSLGGADVKGASSIDPEEEDVTFDMHLTSSSELTKYSNVLKLVFNTSSPLFASHAITFINTELGIEREYSPTEARVAGGKLQLHFVVKVYPGGAMSQWLSKRNTGDVVKIREKQTVGLSSPTQHGCWKRLIMLAAGTGLNPMLKIIAHHAEEADTPALANMVLVLIWWVPTTDEAYFSRDDFDILQQKLGGRLKIRVCITQEIDQVRSYGKVADTQQGTAIVKSRRPSTESERSSGSKVALKGARPSTPETARGASPGAWEEKPRAGEAATPRSSPRATPRGAEGTGDVRRAPPGPPKVQKREAQKGTNFVVASGRDTKGAFDWMKAELSAKEHATRGIVDKFEQRALICGPHGFTREIEKQLKKSFLGIGDDVTIL